VFKGLIVLQMLTVADGVWGCVVVAVWLIGPAGYDCCGRDLWAPRMNIDIR